MKRILVIGAAGQIGSELVPFLREKYGKENVIATGRKTRLPQKMLDGGPCIYLDALDQESLKKVLYENQIDTIYHMASILSATGEKMPQTAWDINMNGLVNVLEVSRRYDIERIIWPSSIAAFGPTTPRENTPNETILQPTTMYGITKVAGELMAEYYFKKYGLDTRSMRLPGIISSETPPGGGTTDYAVEIFYEAIKNKKYTCFLREDTVLPMMYQPDCLKCHIDLAEADASKLKRRIFNVTGMSFSAGEIAAEIKKHIPEFTIDYKPDFRQEIADSWPKSIDDSLARKEWGWNPKYDLAKMTKDMLDKLSKRL
ncbi:MAG TPA: NAD-dependent epimerase/dehydratase family protein [candidate division Zixibacteria bacterium]|nr:NAD-dependent epimerase/dehydratase family protein [candidate division Zixibacteria bacterium]